jgi:hypothetical protein
MSKEESDFPLPTKKRKLWNTTSKSLKKDPNWKPAIPNFCPCKDPKTDKRCGRLFHSVWDIQFYEQYGMCETCYIKYNSHLEELGVDVEEKIRQLREIGNVEEEPKQ